MKRILFIGAVLAVAILFLVLLRLPESNAPQFKTLRTAPSLQPSGVIGYGFSSPRPFEGGKMWISVELSRTNIETFLDDIDHRKVVGQLIKGWPVAMIDRSTA